MYFIKRWMNKIGRFISKPGAFIYQIISDLMYSGTTEMLLSAIVFIFFIAIIILEVFFNKSEMNSLNIVILLVIAFFGISLSIGLINLLVPVILGAICKLTKPFEYLNSLCNKNLSKDLDGEPCCTTSTDWGVGPDAEVGIKYFIEIDKKSNKNGYYKAKYIGK